jgi:hypothetical protein
MPNYSIPILTAHFHNCDHGATNQIKGRAFEDLACYLFSTIPGVPITMRNQMNAFNNEEIDVALWNEKSRFGLNFLPNVILVECKNWSRPVSSIEVSWFCQKLASRGQKFGILIANNGITGNPNELTASHNTLAHHLSQERTVIVITRTEINALRNTNDMIKLIKEKICRLVVGGSIA